MQKRPRNLLGSLEGRRFVIGREGHIYVDDPAVSKEHAEMTIVGGRVRIRDLNSTNGLFVIDNNRQVPLKDGFVDPDQVIAIGQQQHLVKTLLAIVGSFAE